MKKINFLLADSNVLTSNIINGFYSVVIPSKYDIIDEDKPSPVLSDKYVFYISFKDKSLINEVFVKDGVLKIRRRDEALDYYTLDIISYDKIFDRNFVNDYNPNDANVKEILSYFSRIIRRGILSFAFVDKGVLLLLEDTNMLLLDYRNPLFYMFVSFLSLYYNRYVVIDDNIIRSNSYYVYMYYTSILSMIKDLDDVQVTFICRDDSFYAPVSISIANLKIDINDISAYILDADIGFIEFSFLDDGSLGPTLNHRFFSFKVEMSKMIIQSKKELIEKGELEFRKQLMDIINKRPDLKSLIEELLGVDQSIDQSYIDTPNNL
ncbi:MAG: hypothetical protein QXS19_06220 [Candidatus Methanomethylicia archaeon]